MAKTYRTTVFRRVGNAVIGKVLRVLPVGPYVLLSVRGRTTGQPRTTPVRVMRHGGHRYLVAPYGPVPWALNLRAAGEASLRSGPRSRTYAVAECAPDEAGPVLKAYARVEPITRPYFDAAASDPAEAFAAEAGRHPVFRLVES